MLLCMLEQLGGAQFQALVIHIVDLVYIINLLLFIFSYLLY